MKFRWLAVFITVAFAQPCLLAADTATFRYYGEITDVADNGAILMGGGVRTPDGKVIEINAFGPKYMVSTVATEISHDGSIIAGHGSTPDSQFYQGWIKRGDEGVAPIGTLGGDRSLVWGMSDDGRVLAGTSFNAEGRSQGFLWKQETGMTPIPYFPNASGASIAGLSADGSIAVGRSTIICPECDPGWVSWDCAGECGPPVASYSQSFIWSEAGGLVSLGTLRETPNTVDEFGRPPTPQDTYATGISDDGTTAIGYTTGEFPSGGYVWGAETGMRLVPPLAGHGFSTFFPLDVSGDGSIVVGRIGGSCGINCFSGPGAVIWDAVHGTRLLKTVLVEEFGLEEKIGTDFLEHASFISADGRVIAGYGDRTKGRGSWLVTLPRPISAPEPSTLWLIIAAISIASSARLRR